MEISLLPFLLPSPLEPLDVLPGVDLWMKRDDLIHPVVSGNKWRKLKGHFEALQLGQTILSFGGAYSNHLPALACAAQAAGVRVIGVVRGEELTPGSNPILSYCEDQGMALHFVSREAYRELRERNWGPSPEQSALWGAAEAVVVPEGGAGPLALVGCGEIWREIAGAMLPDHLVLASGTGTTAEGIIRAMPLGCATAVHVVSAVAGAHKERARVEAVAQERQIQLNWVEGEPKGFGKVNKELLEERDRFAATTGIDLDRNYNAKVWRYLKGQTWQGRVVWLHTGGIKDGLI